MATNPTIWRRAVVAARSALQPIFGGPVAINDEVAQTLAKSVVDWPSAEDDTPRAPYHRLLSVKSVMVAETTTANDQRAGVASNWKAEAAINDGLKASTWVYACVYRIAKAAAMVPWLVERRDPATGGWVPVPGHPAAALIEAPNAHWSRQDLIERITMHLYLAGESFVSKARARGQVRELWVLSPDIVIPIPDPATFLARYDVTVNGRRRPVAVGDMFQLKFTDPSNPYRGLAPLQAAARPVNTDVAATKWNETAMGNRAVSDGVFTLEGDLTQEQYDQAKALVREQHQGHASAREPWVLGNGAKWSPMDRTPVEMDFIESRRFTREEICAVFGVPQPVVGILDHANYANIKTAREIFWLDTVIPFLEDLAGGFTRGILREFESDTANMRISFDLSNVEALAGVHDARLKTARAAWDMGVPLNVLNAVHRLRYPVQPGGDVGFVAANVQPVDTFTADSMAGADGADFAGGGAEDTEDDGPATSLRGGPVT